MDFKTKEKILFLAKQLMCELDCIDGLQSSYFVDSVLNGIWNNDSIALETMLNELYEEDEVMP